MKRHHLLPSWRQLPYRVRWLLYYWQVFWRGLPWWKWVLVVIGGFYAVAYVLPENPWIGLKGEQSTSEGPTLEQRIDVLTTRLRNAAADISAIESEVEARQELVSKLQQDQQRYEALTRMDREEVEAIAQTLEEQIQKSKAFWDTIQGRFMWSLGFLLLGASLAPLSRWGRRLLS